MDINFPVFQIEKKIDVDSIYQIIGTGFFVLADGTFLTAKHNIDLNDLESYRIRYNGNILSPIYRIDKIDYSYQGIDIIPLKTYCNNLNIPFNEIAAESNLSSYIGSEVYVCGYLNEGAKRLLTKSVISEFNNNIFTLQDGCAGTGISGSPVFITNGNKLVGIVSKRVTQVEGLNLCFIYPISFLKTISLDLYHKISSTFTNIKLGYIENIKNAELSTLLDYKELSNLYLNNGNPVELFFTIDNYIQNCINKSGNNELFNLYHFYELAGQLLIHSRINDASSESARAYLSKAKELLNNSAQINDQIIVDLAKIEWLIGNTYHQQQNYDMAYDTIYKVIKNNEHILSKKDLIPMYRELSIITKSEDDFVKINEDIIEYKNSPLEIYHTKARTFEFYLKNYNLIKVDEIYVDLVKSFKEVYKFLPQVYVISFYKYLYAYFRLKGDKKRYNSYYELVEKYSEKLSLKGQLNSLKKLKQIFDQDGLL